MANPISYGWVNNAQLSDLTPTGVRAPYDLLLKRRLAETVPALRKELADHPASLAAYVGLLQADPSIWPAEANRLRKMTAHTDPAPDDLFKLGALLFYQWGQQPAPPRDKETLAQAQTLLGRAWHREHKPIYGLMLGETLEAGTVSSDPSLKGLSTKTINQRLVKELAGPIAYRQYLQAQKVDWRASPPAVSLVSAVNRKSLLAVIASLRSQSHRRGGTGKFVNGRVEMVWDAVPPVQVAQQQYMDAWYSVLVVATKEA